MKTGKNTMKKLMIVLLALVLVMSVNACGGDADASSQETDSSSKEATEEKPEAETTDSNSETEEPTAEPVETGRDADELKDVFVEAYMGLTEGGQGVYYAGSADGEIGLLMFLDGDNAEHYVFVGPVVDNGDGTVTITDEEDGLTLTFGVSVIEDGIEIDMGDELGSAVLGEVTVEEVIDIMVQIESGTTAILPDQGVDLSYLNDIITEAYAGAFADEMMVYIANNEDGSFMVVMLLSPDMTESVSFVGSATSEGNYITVTDDATGDELTFTVSEDGDGMLLDMGDIGEAVVSEVDIADMIAALETIVSGTDVLR